MDSDPEILDSDSEPELDPADILDPGQMGSNDIDSGQMRPITINADDFDKKYRVSSP